MNDKLSNTERNLHEELLIKKGNPAGKLSEREWERQQKRNEESKRLEEIESKLTNINKGNKA